MSRLTTRREFLGYAPLAAGAVMAACAWPASLAPATPPTSTGQPVQPSPSAPPFPMNAANWRPMVLAAEGASRPLPNHIFAARFGRPVTQLDPRKPVELPADSLVRLVWE